MKEQLRQGYTKRELLCGEQRFRPRICVDMEAVYEDLNNKMTLEAVAKKYKVSVSTLRRRHKEYQAAIALMEEENSLEEKNEGYKLPPLPPGI